MNQLIQVAFHCDLVGADVSDATTRYVPLCSWFYGIASVVFVPIFCTLIVLIIVGDFNSDKEISVNTDGSVIASNVEITRFVSRLSLFNVNLVNMHLW